MKPLAEIYTIHFFALLSNLIFLCKQMRKLVRKIPVDAFAKVAKERFAGIKSELQATEVKLEGVAGMMDQISRLSNNFPREVAKVT